MNEEPNQIKCYCGHTTMCDCSPIESKQQTVEEVAERIAMTKDWDFESSEGNGYYDYVEGFTEGAKSDAARDYWYAKWQQEKSYSEEDLRKAWEDGRNNVITVGKPPFVITKFQHNSFSNWFKKFKKK